MNKCRYISNENYVFFTNELLDDIGVKVGGDYKKYGVYEPFEYLGKLYRPIQLSLSGCECKEYEVME